MTSCCSCRLADHNRYLTEVHLADDLKEFYSGEAETHYLQAYTMSQSQLKPTHPIRLGVALNYAVFSYEIKLNPGQTCSPHSHPHSHPPTLNFSHSTTQQTKLLICRNKLLIWPWLIWILYRRAHTKIPLLSYN